MCHLIIRELTSLCDRKHGMRWIKDGTDLSGGILDIEEKIGSC